jgi:hypothetical protein
MLTNTPVSFVNTVDFKMQAFLVGTSMVLDTTTSPLLSALECQQGQLRQLAQADKFSLLVSANAQLDSALSLDYAKRSHHACQLNSPWVESVLALQVRLLQQLVSAV